MNVLNVNGQAEGLSIEMNHQNLLTNQQNATRQDVKEWLFFGIIRLRVVHHKSADNRFYFSIFFP